MKYILTKSQVEILRDQMSSEILGRKDFEKYLIDYVNNLEEYKIDEEGEYYEALSWAYVNIEKAWDQYANNKWQQEKNYFTLKDMRAAFMAGERFEKNTIEYDMEEVEEVELPDFGDWMKEDYNIDID
jgi:hypothetical protein